MHHLLKDNFEEINYWIKEANICIDTTLGYSGILTLFAIIFTVGDSIYQIEKSAGTITDPNDNGDKALVKRFVHNLPNYDFVFANKPGLVIDEDKVINLLIDIRHGLTHQISLPDDIGLVTYPKDKNYFAKYPDINYVICLKVLKNLVNLTTKVIIDKYPLAEMDNGQGKSKKRSIGKQIKTTKKRSSVIAGSAVKKY